MFGANSANRICQVVGAHRRAARRTRSKATATISIWVDWNNDRHQDGWLTYMNLGADSWRNHITARIADAIERYGVDAYFLDIVGGHVNSTNGDMHEGTRRLVMDLRGEVSEGACASARCRTTRCTSFIPMYHAGGGARWQKYSRFFQHLSAPAPGRGSRAACTRRASAASTRRR